VGADVGHEATKPPEPQSCAPTAFAGA
jgi:hypothetical protein